MTREVSVQVKPGSKKGPLIQTSLTGELLVYVREPAVDGKANIALVELIARHYDVPKSAVKIIRGLSSRHKHIRIATM